MTNNTGTVVTSHDPWYDLVRQSAVVAVPLDQVLAGLRVAQPETEAVKDELMAKLMRILAEARQDGE